MPNDSIDPKRIINTFVEILVFIALYPLIRDMINETIKEVLENKR